MNHGLGSVQHDARLVMEYLWAEGPRRWAEWSGGWPEEIEVGLIDAVLSIRATYGGSSTGVRAAVTRYREWSAGQGRAPDALDDLQHLASLTPDVLVEVLRNRQRTVGGLKAEAIIDAANGLLALGVRCADQLDPDNDAQAGAYTSILGLGEISWQYLGLVLGRPGAALIDASVRSLVHILGRPISITHAADVVLAAAAVLEVTVPTVHRALWALDRAQPADRHRLSG